MFVIPVFMIVMAVMCAFATYFLSRHKLLNEGIMSSPDYIGGALIEVFLITFVQALSLFMGMGIYNMIAAKSPAKLAALSTMEIWIVLTVVALGAVTPASLFIRQLNKLKTAQKSNQADDREGQAVRVEVDAKKLSRVIDAGSSPTTELSNLSWPTFPSLPKNVQKELDALQVLWSNQQDKVHTAEEEYLLERTVTDYIPSSMNLYLPFISAGMKREYTARKALLSQLQLIKDHLENISEQNFNEQMRTVNAQTEFLKNRFSTWSN